jgi:hypothetical protein
LQPRVADQPLKRLVSTTAVVLVALVSAATASAGITQHATTASYSLTLDIGPTAAMYTQAQVKAKHITNGEVMLGGAMMSTSMSAMKGETERHLELHVYSRKTGAVVSNVMPEITLTDTTAMGMAAKLDVVSMEGITEGASDYHYGNNVSLKLGDEYTVNAVVHGEKASFTFKAV